MSNQHAFEDFVFERRAKILTVYSYAPKGARTQRRWAVATGDRPEDVISTHGTKRVAVRAAERLAKQPGYLGPTVEV